jgi:hypothetical protein
MFKIGDLVKVKEGTSDARMPDSRLGLILSYAKWPGYDFSHPDVFLVLFTNGACLRFHEMWLESVNGHPGS